MNYCVSDEAKSRTKIYNFIMQIIIIMLCTQLWKIHCGQIISNYLYFKVNFQYVIYIWRFQEITAIILPLKKLIQKEGLQEKVE